MAGTILRLLTEDLTPEQLYEILNTSGSLSHLVSTHNHPGLGKAFQNRHPFMHEVFNFSKANAPNSVSIKSYPKLYELANYYNSAKKDTIHDIHKNDSKCAMILALMLKHHILKNPELNFIVQAKEMQAMFVEPDGSLKNEPDRAAIMVKIHAIITEANIEERVEKALALRDKENSLKANAAETSATSSAIDTHHSTPTRPVSTPLPVATNTTSHPPMVLHSPAVQRRQVNKKEDSDESPTHEHDQTDSPISADGHDTHAETERRDTHHTELTLPDSNSMPLHSPAVTRRGLKLDHESDDSNDSPPPEQDHKHDTTLNSQKPKIVIQTPALVQREIDQRRRAAGSNESSPIDYGSEHSDDGNSDVSVVVKTDGLQTPPDPHSDDENVAPAAPPPSPTPDATFIIRVSPVSESHHITSMPGASGHTLPSSTNPFDDASSITTTTSVATASGHSVTASTNPFDVALPITATATKIETVRHTLVHSAVHGSPPQPTTHLHLAAPTNDESDATPPLVDQHKHQAIDTLASHKHDGTNTETHHSHHQHHNSGDKRTTAHVLPPPIPPHLMPTSASEAHHHTTVTTQVPHKTPQHPLPTSDATHHAHHASDNTHGTTHLPPPIPTQTGTNTEIQRHTADATHQQSDNVERTTQQTQTTAHDVAKHEAAIPSTTNTAVVTKHPKVEAHIHNTAAHTAPVTKKTTATLTHKEAVEAFLIGMIQNRKAHIAAEVLKDANYIHSSKVYDKQFELDYFHTHLSTLNVAALKYLTLYMHDIQTGALTDARFNYLRQERFYLLSPQGNTVEWVAARHAVKHFLMQKVEEAALQAHPSVTSPNATRHVGKHEAAHHKAQGHKNITTVIVPGKKVPLSANEHQLISRMINDHSGRPFFRVGRTNSSYTFDNKFEVSHTPTAPKLR